MKTNQLRVTSLLFAAGLCLDLALPWAHAAESLKVKASLSWEDLCTGDPVRVRVRLSSPQSRQEAAARLRQIEDAVLWNDPSPPPPVYAPPISNYWQEGVLLELYRINPDSTRQLVITADKWANYLRPLVAEPVTGDDLLIARSREWLVPATNAALKPGSYEVAVAWAGAGLTDTNLLPTDGVLHGTTLAFAVREPTNDVDRATHLGRLAFQEFMAGNSSSARSYGTEALRLDPNNRGRERVETYFVVAHSSLREKDYLGSATAFGNLLQAYPDSAGDEIIQVGLERFQMLSPRLRVPENSNSGGRFHYEILGQPDQRYISYLSTDLIHWAAFSTNTAAAEGIASVVDQKSPGTGNRFYRSIWVP